MQRFTGDNFTGWVQLLQIITRGYCTGGTSGQCHATIVVTWAGNLLEDLINGMTGNLVMPHVIAK
ncbi:MAG: hypothetical protein ACD_35C00256G0001, partial [uncultured bacterium]